MPLTRRQIYRRRRTAVIAVVIAVIAFGIYLPLTLLTPLGSPQVSVPAVAVSSGTAPTIDWPSFGSSAFSIVGDDASMQTSGNGAALPMASISKIITALVVLQAKPLTVGDEGPTITFSQADHALYEKYIALDGSVKPMPAGASMSEHQVLQVALIASANNYAETIADWAYGSESAYVTAATSWLKAHGLDHTTLVEPSGIDPANTSTASDLVALGKLAIANPVLAAIVDTPTITLPVVGTIRDGNQLLGRDGVIGIKTGTLTTTSSLLFAARIRRSGTTVTVVGAVLGATERSAVGPAVTALLKQVAAGIHVVTLAKKGQSFATYSTGWGRRASAVATATKSTAVWAGTPISASVAPPSSAAGTKTATGSVSFAVGPTSIRVPLTLDHAISAPSPWWRLSHPFAARG
jgi:D-alanyl-D-alanine carboxypeptidase (penicillin-binding protein 5/6)